MSLPTCDDIESGTAVLFLGAGFSAEATNINGAKVKDVSGLIEQLLSSIGETNTDGYDLETAAEEFLAFHGKLGTTRLTSLLHSNFRSSAATDSQHIIVTQPWHRIYTTNYDDVIERICTENKKPITTAEISDPVSPPQANTTQLIHIYGNISRATPDEFTRHFLLTESQRDDSRFLQSPWIRRLRDDILSTKAIVFVGFSLSDIDIRRLMIKLPKDVFKKVHFVIKEDSSRPRIARLKRFGNVHPIGLDALSSHLQQRRNFAPKRSYNFLPSYLRELAFDQSQSKRISPKDIELLMISGDVALENISNSDTSAQKGSYLISRDDAKYNRAIRNSSSDLPIVVHSDIGNGKTIFLYQIAYLFSQNGYKVYEALMEPEDTGELIRFLQMSEGPILVVFDNLTRFPTLPSAVKAIGRKDIVIAASVRSAFIHTSRERVVAALGRSTPIEIDLNTLQRTETRNITRYLDENGLFGKLAELSDLEKQQLIEKECNGQLRDVILTLYERGALRTKVEELLGAIRALDKPSRSVIALSALMTRADFKHLCLYSDVSDLVSCDKSLEDVRSSLSESELSTLINLDAGNIEIKSTALAHFILSRVFSIDEILESAKASLFCIDAFYSDELEFVRLGKVLLKFSSYGSFVTGQQSRKALDNFYDECRVLSFAESDPLFWVQRSICCMHNSEFSISERFIETAYSLASQRREGFDTYQIDNHNAHLILKKTLHVGMSVDGGDERKAQQLLERVIRRKADDLYHPLSVMRLYIDIASQWKDTMSELQKSALRDIIDSATKILSGKREGGRFRNIPYLRTRLLEVRKTLSP